MASGLTNAGHWAIPTLCTYLAFGTLMGNLRRVVQDPAESARFVQALAWPAAVTLIALLAGWACYRWKRWAPFLAIALFGRHVFTVLGGFAAAPEPALALVEAGLFTLGAAWFVLPEVRVQFRLSW